MDQPQVNMPVPMARPVMMKPPQALPGATPKEAVEPPTNIDRMIHAAMGRTTSGLSPAALALAYADWALHLAMSPGKWARLSEKAMRKAVLFQRHVLHSLADPHIEPCIEPLPQDRRFRDPSWQRFPYQFIYQGFLLHQQWWHNLTTGIGGVSYHHEQVVAFASRQLLDMVSPVNFITTNPQVMDATIREGGRNLLRGAMNFMEDWGRTASGKPAVGTEQYQPGQSVAVTAGSVVFRNRLIELIQYSPTTADVHPEPILIVPAWIMKYYILDLSEHNSMVKFLVDRGHTVFMISWHNPTAADSDLDMEDYLRLGLLDAMEAVRAIVPGCRVNAVGYCLGGTLLSIGAAFLAQKGNDGYLNSLTLLAAQTDFTEAGELRLFIDDSQLGYLEDIMWSQGYLDTKQMAGAFQMLRSNDLIWSHMVNDYLLGKREPMSDLMAWNADATRLPYRMHSEYLRQLFLKNDLFEGRYKVEGKPVALSDITTPMFVVSTEADHVAPWKSVYKINLLADADVTFVLTSGGHNAGIISEPGHPHRHYRLSSPARGTRYVDPDNWFAMTPAVEGSWWTAWVKWLEHIDSGRVAPPAMGAPEKGYAVLGPAPGSYVLER